MAPWGHSRPSSRFRWGETLFAASERDFKFFIVKSGEVAIVDHPSGQDEIVTVHGPREFTRDVNMLIGRPVSSFTHHVARGHTAFAYVLEGEASFADDDHTRLVVWGDGDHLKVVNAENGVRFLLVSGKPLNEPIARNGPFVMNTREEIEQALSDLRHGTFVRED